MIFRKNTVNNMNEEDVDWRNPQLTLTSTDTVMIYPEMAYKFLVKFYKTKKDVGLEEAVLEFETNLNSIKTHPFYFYLVFNQMLNKQIIVSYVLMFLTFAAAGSFYVIGFGDLISATHELKLIFKLISGVFGGFLILLFNINNNLKIISEKFWNWVRHSGK